MLALFMCFGSIMLVQNADEQLANSIDTAYEANRALFPFGMIRFTYTVGRSESESAAVAGRLTQSATATGFYAFDSARGRFECIFDADAMLKAEKAGMHLFSMRVLTDGSKTLWDRIGARENAGVAEHTHTAQIDAGTSPFYREVIAPLKIGVPGKRTALLYRTQDALAGVGDLRVTSIDRAGSLDGADVVIWNYESPEALSAVWIDLERGAIPRLVRHVLRKENRTWIERHDDIRHLAERGWLPHKWLLRSPDGTTRVLTVVESDFATPPSSDLFHLDFKSPTPVVDVTRAVKHKPRQRFEASAISTRAPSGEEKLSVALSGPPDESMRLPGERDARPWWAIPLAVLGIACFGAAAVVAYRKRHAYR